MRLSAWFLKRWSGRLSATCKPDAKPFCVVATVGTTSTTSIDPVRAIAEVAQRHGLWVHVDAAYAGSAAIVPELQYILDGAELADSLVVNPHKWLFTPLDCSVLLTRRPDILRRAFTLVPEYLRTFEDPRMVNLMEYGIPLGRRFRALKLWFIFRAFGREGLVELIRSHVAMAQEMAEWIAADARFEVVAPVPLSVVCFRLRGADEQKPCVAGGYQRRRRRVPVAHCLERASGAAGGDREHRNVARKRCWRRGPGFRNCVRDACLQQVSDTLT